jgi:N-acetylneuraminic acid mutarotase
MARFEPQRIALLLSLLLACAPAPLEGQEEQDLAAPQSLASAVAAPGWSPTGYLSRARSGHTATLLSNGKVLAVGGISGGSTLSAAEVYDPGTGTWSVTGSLAQSREAHTATLLPSGKLLVVGGRRGNTPLASCELYDPETGTWTSTGSLIQARFGHTAVMIRGRILVVGGSTGTLSLASAEVYDPATGTWSSAPSLTQAREHHTATLLPDGRVLVAGGIQGTALLASAEVYDPVAGAWSAAGSLTQAREYHTATLLPDGKLLVVGGRGPGSISLASAEAYDTATGTWSSTGMGSLAQPRDRHSAILLSNGQLLVTGGFWRSSSGSGPVSATELYNPVTRTWSSGGSLTRGRFHLTATLLLGGEVLVAGGSTWEVSGIVTEVVAEVSNLVAKTWSPAGSLAQPRRDHTATVLPDGKVLIVGGGDRYSGAFSHVDMYDPRSGAWSAAAPLLQARRSHTATLLPGGKILVVGGYSGSTLLDSVELYDPSTRSWSFTNPLHQARLDHTATLLPDGKVLVVGGYGEQASLASAEVYDPDTGTWSLTQPLTQARAGHAAILLQGGKVLALGGEEDILSPLYSAEVYDIVARQWSAARAMRRSRRLFTATLLPDGRILVAGGEDASRTPLSSAEVYTPDTGSSSTGAMLTSRALATATLLPGGKVLVAGGSRSLFDPPAVAAEVYDPATEVWSAAGWLTQAREEHTATLLPGGKVLVVGGMDPTGSGTYELASAELYANMNENETRRPRITGVSLARLEGGSPFTVAGDRFLNSFEASSSSTQSSATNHPLLSLIAIESGGWVPLLGRDFSDTSVSAILPYIPSGYYLLNVTTQGLTSSQVVSVITNSLPDTTLDSATPAPFTQESTATFSFSSQVAASFVCSLDTFVIANCTSPQRYLSLSEGEHLFQVHAINDSGQADPTPAVHRWVVDRTGPETTIDLPSAPPASTRNRSARFSFSSSDEGSSFECSLDGAAFTSCSSSQEYSGLADGEHTFQVRATDRAGNHEPSPAEYRWVVDTVPPGHPDLLTPVANQQLSTSSTFFSGTGDPGSTVRVLVDDVPVGGGVLVNENGGWELDAPGLDEGPHRARAVATDPAGNLSEPSAEVSWVIDRTSPETTIDTTSVPLAVTRDKTASFSFASPEEGASFECSLDTGEFKACSSPQEYSGLEDSRHTFQVRAIDRASNRDLSAAEHRWTVDTQPPGQPTISVPTPHQKIQASSTVISGSGEPHGTVQVHIDGSLVNDAVKADENGKWELDSPLLDWGTHTVKAVAVDPVGNPSTSAEVSFAMVQRSHYGIGCAAASSGTWPWLWVLLLPGLLRRRSHAR